MDGSDEPAASHPPESSHNIVDSSGGRRKRGRPPSQQLATVEERTVEDPKEKKRIIDKESRQENREVLVGFTQLTPNLKELIQLIMELTQQGAIEKLKEISLLLERVKQCNLVELIGTNERDIAEQQLIKDAIMEVRKVPSLLKEVLQNQQELKDAIMEGLGNVLTLLKEVQHSQQEFKMLIDGWRQVLPANIPQIPAYNTGTFLPQPAAETTSNEQQTNENEERTDFLSSIISDECADESITVCINSPSTSCDEISESVDYEQGYSFFQECDGNLKREVNLTDLDGLEEALNKVGRNEVPAVLHPIADKIKTFYGDITERTTQSKYAAHTTLVMFYATVKEMDEVKGYKDISVNKLRVWRDVILDALEIKFSANFAGNHLLKIARAYFGFKLARNQKLNEQEKSLRAEWGLLQEKIKKRQDWYVETANFSGKPLNTGLFP